MGRVDARFAEMLEQRQREDGVVVVSSANATQLTQIVSSSILLGSPMPMQRRRSDIVVSVVWDPIPRYRIPKMTKKAKMREICKSEAKSRSLAGGFVGVVPAVIVVVLFQLSLSLLLLFIVVGLV
jgi:hypothetical protein